ncbi:hypothetical protein ZYGR_0S01630 [Zygosaccharomyces rouxii]|uniref:Spindle pole component 29 n=2 Tax=Zygosaccharomyces rouxii TaxID=4956 RepID=C5DXL9_ZYGRC|nr:uncharacterized protein ZYRO0F06116g [Zygosaccharomyces rouxii]KAH9199290.1 hypothetical protein LQ764DRAFT_128688 [Zygosaccharomyces rouxii]GAV50029.1 hypothetical protein ZYGR_0S01630 [Zygosaccharomyces rouxii]CAR28530.1 ZYRO0F06116p [Zygosaccharomyces rouxii]
MADLTREFFDRPENDDTLQNIRRQYLESKRNLQDLMMKQNQNGDADADDAVGVGIGVGIGGGVNDQSAKIRRGFKSPLKPKEVMMENRPTSDNLIMMNEVRSLKSLVYEQQAQIRRLQADLQFQKNSEFEFQRSILQFQSQLKNLRDEFAEFKLSKSYNIDNNQDHYNRNVSFESPPFDDSTTRLIQISGQKR